MKPRIRWLGLMIRLALMYVLPAALVRMFPEQCHSGFDTHEHRIRIHEQNDRANSPMMPTRLAHCAFRDTVEADGIHLKPYRLSCMSDG